MARVQGVKVSDAVDPKQHGHAIDHELPEPLLACGLDDPRIAVAPVVAAPRDQANAIPIALQAEAIAVILRGANSRDRRRWSLPRQFWGLARCSRIFKGSRCHPYTSPWRGR